MLPLDHPDRIQIAFDDHRLVASAPRFRGGRVWRAATALTTPTCCAPAGRLARWTARIGLGEQLVTTKTLRRRFFSMAGRLTPLGAPKNACRPRPTPRLPEFEPGPSRL